MGQCFFLSASSLRPLLSTSIRSSLPPSTSVLSLTPRRPRWMSTFSTVHLIIMQITASSAWHQSPVEHPAIHARRRFRFRGRLPGSKRDSSISGTLWSLKADKTRALARCQPRTWRGGKFRKVNIASTPPGLQGLNSSPPHSCLVQLPKSLPASLKHSMTVEEVSFSVSTPLFTLLM